MNGEPADVVMAKVLLHLEAEVHEKGWDQPAQLHALVGPGTESNGWTLEALMADPVFFARQHPRDAVRGFADFLTMPLPPGFPAAGVEGREFILDGLAAGPLHAVLLITEAWGFEGTQEERGQVRSLGDHPGAYEMRQLVAVAPDSTVYVVSRRRGREPVARWRNHATGQSRAIGEATGPAEDQDLQVVAGGMTRSLRRIVNAVNARAGVPLIAHVRDTCNRCGEPMPVRGGVPVAVCPACGNGS